MSYYPRPASELGADEEELNIMRGTTRYVEQRSIPSTSALQDDRARQYLANTPRTSVNNGSSLAALKDMNMDCLLSPSTLVQTPPEPIPYCDADEADWYGTGRNCAFDQYIPPVVEATSRNREDASAWSAGAHQDPTIPSVQPSERQQHHPEQTSHAHHYQSRSQESTSTSPFSGTHEPATPPDFLSDMQTDTSNIQYTSSHSEINNPQSLPNYSFAPNSTGTTYSFMHNQNSLPSTADLNALYEKVDTASADAWRSFMQQFELTNVDVQGFNWEAVAFN